MSLLRLALASLSVRVVRLVSFHVFVFEVMLTHLCLVGTGIITNIIETA